MTEGTKLPTSEAELRGLLEQAMEYGKQEAQKAGPTKEPAPDTPALNVDSLRADALRAEFRERMAELRADRRKTPAKARAIQQEFIEKGLSVEEVDIAPRGNARDERHNDLQHAAYRRVIGPRSR